MDTLIKFLNIVPRPVLELLRPLRNTIVRNKYTAELLFWKSRFLLENSNFQNNFYQEIMLAMAEEPNDNFLKGKVVADFGCGPRGSLVWAKSASLRIGIDVLVDKYVDEFPSVILKHDMIYLKSTEKFIPLPSNFVDILFTLNAMDHVDSFSTMCGEVFRIIKPGGYLIGSFNLLEPRTPTEPQELSEDIIKKNLLRLMDVHSYRISAQTEDDKYAGLKSGIVSYITGGKSILWVKAKKIS